MLNFLFSHRPSPAPLPPLKLGNSKWLLAAASQGQLFITKQPKASLWCPAFNHLWNVLWSLGGQWGSKTIFWPVMETWAGCANRNEQPVEEEGWSEDNREDNSKRTKEKTKLIRDSELRDFRGFWPSPSILHKETGKYTGPVPGLTSNS